MTATDERRLVLFEVGGGAYALPIADVIEVTDDYTREPVGASSLRASWVARRRSSL